MIAPLAIDGITAVAKASRLRGWPRSPRLKKRPVLETTAKRKSFKGLFDFLRASALDAVR